MDASGAVLTTGLAAEQVLAFPERYVHQFGCHPMDWMSEALRDRGMASGTVAIEMEANYYTVRSHNALVTGLPNATFVDAQNLVNWLRSVKSDAEVEKMRIAGRIIERVMTQALEMIEPGGAPVRSGR